MTRERSLPSLSYRTPNRVVMHLRNQPDIASFTIVGAARLNDAFGTGSGVGGHGTVTMFTVPKGGFYQSPRCAAKRIPFDESTADRTLMIFDPDDFATPVDPAGSYLPSDDNVLFLRVVVTNTAGVDRAPGPIYIVPPYDFNTTKEPVFTVTGKAPTLGIGSTDIPDTLGSGAMNFLLPAYAGMTSITNLHASIPLFVSFHPGLPPLVIPGGQDRFITGGIPEIFVAAPNGNPTFTMALSIVNSA